MNRGQNSRIVAWVARLILCLGCACGSENSRAQEARALLERIAALDLRAPPAERARQIEHLRALQLADPDLARVRGACVLAHAGLLAAESEQAGVRSRLDRAGDAGLREPELTLVAATVRQAGERLRDAQAALPECETRTRALLERYR
jgi:hypothetical protein